MNISVKKRIVALLILTLTPPVLSFAAVDDSQPEQQFLKTHRMISGFRRVSSDDDKLPNAMAFIRCLLILSVHYNIRLSDITEGS
ncbi:hypothetical protein LVQ78_23615 [Buttiauxella sp. A2-C2_NF]|uniref:hypothetical protein n=1 Tax=Buttiauxella ferragutiae TaxID=82989 RepID=UPI001E46BDB8|nr:hypothetical protein [Buttiauxella ferragutiae]MCE0828982.1 hypothetical protein [Buttiauxella ferragutiae]